MFDVQALRADADEIEACGGGNEAARMREAAAEIERLRDVVEAAYIEGALTFGGFTQNTGDRALERFPVSDAFRWREDPAEWAADQSKNGEK